MARTFRCLPIRCERFMIALSSYPDFRLSRLIDTSYNPAVTCASRRSHIDQRLKAIETCLDAFHEETARVAAPLYKDWNATTPIHRLSAKILASVILYAIDGTKWPLKRLAELSTVATNWWTVITSTPILWSAIWTYAPGVSVALERSKSAPLSIVIRDPLDSSIVENIGAGGPRGDFDGLISSIGKRTQQWRSAHIRARPLVPILHALSKEMPLLESLHVNLSMAGDMAPLEFGGGRLLNELLVLGADVALGGAVLTELKTITLEHATIDASIWASQFLNAVANCPYLASIELFRILSRNETSPAENQLSILGAVPSPHLLPHLRRFKADTVSSEVIYQLLKNIRVIGELERCLIITTNHFHRALFSAITDPRVPDSLGNSFAGACGNYDLNIEVRESSLVFGTYFKNYAMEFRGDFLLMLSPVAEFCGSERVRVLIRKASVFSDPVSPEFLKFVPRLSHLKIERPNDALEFIFWLLDPDPNRCSELEELGLLWTWDQSHDILFMDSFSSPLATLAEQRPALRIFDSEKNSYRDGRLFLGRLGKRW